MGKTLIVAEKPSVAKDIALALGGFGRADRWLERNDALITAAQGHLAELYAPEMETTGRTLETLPVIPPKFSIKVIEGTNKPEVFRLIQRLMNRDDVDQVVNACDSGREGELIFRLIYEHARCTKPVMRLWCQSMTPDAIRESYRNMKPASEFDHLGAAAFARSEGDYLVGINGSRGVTRLYERLTAKPEIRSVGRVQTPTGALVYDREMQIRTFKAQDYWEVHGHFGVAAGSYSGKWFDPSVKQANQSEPQAEPGSDKPEDHATRFFDKAKADAIVAKCTGVSPSDIKEESKPTSRGAPALYDLTLLQREANTKLGFSAKKTLDIAQALYETHKVTTYPRTDSSALPEDYVAKARSTVESFAGTAYDAHAQRVISNGWVKPIKKIFDNSKITDHFAIVPTGNTPEGLSPDEAKIYDMVARRFLAVFHPAAQYEVTTRITNVSGEHFKSTGRVRVDEGWLAVYGTSIEDEDKKTPPLVKYDHGEPVTTKRIELKGLKTKAPPRYSEATLLAAMESAGKLIDDEDLSDAMKAKGLGTPATRSTIIEKLLADKDGRGQKIEPFMTRDGRELVPTQKLISLIRFLRDNALDVLASPAMTGEWEYKLRLMERGSYTRETFSAEIEDLTRRIIDVIRTKASEVVLSKLNARCPRCSGEVAIGARSYACESGCGFQLGREIAGRTMKQAEVETLISAGSIMNLSGFMSKEKNKKFTACLKLTDEFKAEFFFDPKANTTDASGNPVHCPTCEALMRRISGSRGYFWGCTDRDNCKTLLEDKNGNPVPKTPPQPCPKCAKDMNRIAYKKTHFWACSDRDGCGHTMTDQDGKPVERSQSHPCPDCGKPMYRRERKGGRGGFFWGCSGYKKEGGGCSCILDDENGSPAQKTPAGQV